MSVKATNSVWQFSPARGGNLLVLLAIADHADDHGDAYPSLASLAFKSRMTERGVQKCLQHLQKTGQLKISYNAGPHGKNLYHLDLISTPEQSSPPNIVQGEPQFTGGGEPQFTPKNTSVKTRHIPPIVPQISQRGLVDVWNEICAPAGLPRKLKLNTTLKKKIELRLKEHPEEEFWRTVFTKLTLIKFYRGENDRQWQADLDYIVKNDVNAQRVYERPTTITAQKPAQQYTADGIPKGVM